MRRANLKSLVRKLREVAQPNSYNCYMLDIDTNNIVDGRGNIICSLDNWEEKKKEIIEASSEFYELGIGRRYE